MMRVDFYTKIILTLNVLALSVLIMKPVLSPDPAHARDPKRYDHIQAVSESVFFDKRTGILYVYSGEELAYERRLSELGLPMKASWDQEKVGRAPGHSRD